MLKINYGPSVDYRFCKGCGKCYNACPMDIFGWDEVQKQPTVAYPAECRLCCICELACPELAIDVRFPLHVRFDLGIYPAKSKY
jgi:NAD-dependent dihydropyrimidine dehydrogenase PreA subunit